MQSQFGESPSTDSEDFFSIIAKFINQFKKVSLELYPPSKPTQRYMYNPAVVQVCNMGVI